MSNNVVASWIGRIKKLFPLRGRVLYMSNDYKEFFGHPIETIENNLESVLFDGAQEAEIIGNLLSRLPVGLTVHKNIVTLSRSQKKYFLVNAAITKITTKDIFVLDTIRAIKPTYQLSQIGR